MRYKFRGKDNNGNWIFGDLIYCGDTGLSEIRSSKDKHFEDVMPETVCQYIGKKDKNGVEIYEGDIFESYGNKLYHYIVEYSTFHCAYFGKCIETDYKGLADINNQPIEVVGNIYDNKDLIIKFKYEHNKRKL